MLIRGEDGYALFYNKQKNLITIVLPQTPETTTNTIQKMGRRVTEPKSENLLALLNVARIIFMEAVNQTEDVGDD